MALLLNPRWILTYLRVGTLARAELAGGAPRELASGVHGADWSPDGRELAIVRSGGRRVTGWSFRLAGVLGTRLAMRRCIRRACRLTANASPSSSGHRARVGLSRSRPQASGGFSATAGKSPRGALPGVPTATRSGSPARATQDARPARGFSRPRRTNVAGQLPKTFELFDGRETMAGCSLDTSFNIRLVSSRRSGAETDQITSSIDLNAFLHDISDDGSVVWYMPTPTWRRLKRNDGPRTPSAGAFDRFIP